jgi:hypothetical protein
MSGNYFYHQTTGKYGGGGGGITGSATGTITTTYTWIPSSGLTVQQDPPPATVIVKEWCRAYASTTGPVMPSNPQANNGITSPPSPTLQITYNPYLTYTKKVDYSSERYTILPGNNVVVNCTPSASVNQIPGGCACEVEYYVQLMPVTVSLDGATPDSNSQLHILIGQGCTGTLSVGSPVQLSNYQWTINGSTFKNYVPSTSATHVQYLTTTDLQSTNPHWYWREETNSQSITVECTATATINGQQVGSVTGRAYIKVHAPEYFMEIKTGRVLLGQLPVQNPPLATLIFAGPPTNNSHPNGADWYARVNTPSTPVNFTTTGHGKFNFVQIVTPGRRRTYGSVIDEECLGYGSPALDSTWPYEPDTLPEGYPGWEANIATGGVLIRAGDSPGFTVNALDTNYKIAEDFDVYLMYLPPGNDSKWVSLQLISWTWQCNINRGASWPSPGPAQEVAGGYVASLFDNDSRIHPEWEGLAPAGWLPRQP